MPDEGGLHVVADGLYVALIHFLLAAFVAEPEDKHSVVERGPALKFLLIFSGLIVA